MASSSLAGVTFAGQDASSSSPSTLDWLVALAALMVQLNAGIRLPEIMSGQPFDPDVRSPVNTVAVAVSGVLVGIVCVRHLRRISWLALNNAFAILLTGIIVLSVAWSIHPDVTMRRSAGYALTIVIALYLSMRFAVKDVIKMLSWISAVAAISSFVFTVALPQFGTMPDIGGGWRGVFLHKNRLGLFASVGVFIELYILSGSRPRYAWHLTLLVGYLTLVALSRSATALVLTLGYLTGFGLYWLWRQSTRTAIRGFGALAVGLCVVLALMVFLAAPDVALSLVGKDATLTGRSEVWDVVLKLIRLKPMLGWGYGAMWLGDRNLRLIGWSPASSHDAFLEIALYTGLLGTAVFLIVLGIALWRALRCCLIGDDRLGAFSLIFFIPTILAGTIEITLAQNQNMEWLLFNVLSFSCGLELAKLRATRSAPVNSVAI